MRGIFMKQFLLYSFTFIFLINSCSFLFPMEQQLDRPRASSAADLEQAAATLQTLKDAARKATSKSDIKKIFVAAFGQEQQHWHVIFSCALNDNPPKIVETKLKRLAKLLLAPADSASSGSRLESIKDSKILVEFHKLFTPLSSSSKSKTVRNVLANLEKQLEQKFMEHIENVLASPKDKWLSIFSKNFDSYSENIKKTMLKILAEKFLPKVQELNDSDSLLIGVYLEKFTTTFGPGVPLNKDASICKVIEKLKEKQQTLLKRHSSSIGGILASKFGSLGRSSGKAVQDQSDQTDSLTAPAIASSMQQNQSPLVAQIASKTSNLKLIAQSAPPLVPTREDASIIPPVVVTKPPKPALPKRTISLRDLKQAAQPQASNKQSAHSVGKSPTPTAPLSPLAKNSVTLTATQLSDLKPTRQSARPPVPAREADVKPIAKPAAKPAPPVRSTSLKQLLKQAAAASQSIELAPDKSWQSDLLDLKTLAKSATPTASVAQSSVPSSILSSHAHSSSVQAASEPVTTTVSEQAAPATSISELNDDTNLSETADAEPKSKEATASESSSERIKRELAKGEKEVLTKLESLGILNCLKVLIPLFELEEARARSAENVTSQQSLNLEAIKRTLSDARATVNTPVDNKMCLLHWISELPHNELALKMLIEAGADVHVQDDMGRTPLHRAAAAGLSKAVKLLIAAGANPNAQDQAGETPIFAAAFCYINGKVSDLDRCKVLEVLTASGADINARNKEGKTALCKVLSDWLNHNEDRLLVINTLMNAGALVDAHDCELVHHKSFSKETMLHRAADEGALQLAQMLISAEIDVNAKNDSGTTALHNAAYEGHADMAKLLIKAGALLEEKDISHQTALHIACSRGHCEVIKALVAAGANVETKSTWDRTLLHTAASEGKTEVVSLLIAAQADVNAQDTNNGDTPLQLAAWNGHSEVVKLLLAANADVNAKRTKDDETALHFASREGHDEVVKLLLAAGAQGQVQSRDKGGWTALHEAAAKGDLNNARLLIEKTPIEIKDKIGRTPLHLAALHGKSDMAKLLIAAQADVNVTDTQNGDTPLLLAAWKGHTEIVRQLIAANADVNAKRIYDDTPALLFAAGEGHTAVIKLLAAAGADVNVRYVAEHNKLDKSGASALQMAARFGDLEAVKTLIAAGARVNEKSAKGFTALHSAAIRGHTDIAKLLIASGAKVDEKNLTGMSAMHLLAHGTHTMSEDIDGIHAPEDHDCKGCAETLKLLVAKGAELNDANKNGLTPIELAQREKHEALVMPLTEALAQKAN